MLICAILITPASALNIIKEKLERKFTIETLYINENDFKSLKWILVRDVKFS